MCVRWWWWGQAGLAQPTSRDNKKKKKKDHSAWRKARHKKKHHKIKFKKRNEKKKWGHRQREGAEKQIPSKESERERKNGNPTKGFGIAYCRAWAFLTPSILPLYLLFPLTLSPICLRLFSNLGDSNFLPAMMQQTGTLPSRTLRGSFKSVFFCHENSTTGIVATIGFDPYGKGEDEQFKTFVSRALGRGLQLRADSGSTTKEIYKHQRCFPCRGGKQRLLSPTS